MPGSLESKRFSSEKVMYFLYPTARCVHLPVYKLLCLVYVSGTAMLFQIGGQQEPWEHTPTSSKADRMNIYEVVQAGYCTHLLRYAVQHSKQNAMQAPKIWHLNDTFHLL